MFVFELHALIARQHTVHNCTTASANTSSTNAYSTFVVYVFVQ